MIQLLPRLGRILVFKPVNDSIHLYSIKSQLPHAPSRRWLSSFSQHLLDCPLRDLLFFLYIFCWRFVHQVSDLPTPSQIWGVLDSNVYKSWKETRGALVKREVKKIRARMSSVISHLLIFEIFSSEHEYPRFYVHRILMRFTGFKLESARHPCSTSYSFGS